MKQVLLFKSLSLENGSRMDRQCFENGPMKSWKLFPLFFFLFFLGVGNAWADYKDFSASDFSSSTASTKNPITVTFSAKTINNTQIRFNSGATVQFQSSSGNITKIEVGTNSTNTYIKDMGATVTSGSWSGSGTSYTWTGNTNNITMTAGAACRITSIKVTYSASVTNYTVSWQANGENWAGSSHGTPSTSVASGSKVSTLPTAPASSACDNSKVFVGWTKTPINGTTNTVPTDLFTTIAGSPTITGATTFYAVFATATATNDYKQISEENDLVAGAKYLIVGNSSTTYKALPVDNATNLTSVTPSSSTISTTTAGLIWTLEGSADAWKIKSTSNSKYLQISSGSLTFVNSTNLTFSVGVSSSKFTFTSSASSGNKVLSYYHNGNCFNAYSSANNVYVYKQKINYSAYATSCCQQLGTINGSFFLSHFLRLFSSKFPFSSPLWDYLLISCWFPRILPYLIYTLYISRDFRTFPFFCYLFTSCQRSFYSIFQYRIGVLCLYFVCINSSYVSGKSNRSFSSG